MVNFPYFPSLSSGIPILGYVASFAGWAATATRLETSGQRRQLRRVFTAGVASPWLGWGNHHPFTSYSPGIKVMLQTVFQSDPVTHEIPWTYTLRIFKLAMEHMAHLVRWFSYQKYSKVILLAFSSTKSQQLSLGRWCVLGPSFV